MQVTQSTARWLRWSAPKEHEYVKARGSMIEKD
jgi:hypothetical protein